MGHSNSLHFRGHRANVCQWWDARPACGCLLQVSAIVTAVSEKNNQLPDALWLPHAGFIFLPSLTYFFHWCLFSCNLNTKFWSAKFPVSYISAYILRNRNCLSYAKGNYCKTNLVLEKRKWIKTLKLFMLKFHCFLRKLDNSGGCLDESFEFLEPAVLIYTTISHAVNSS